MAMQKIILSVLLLLLASNVKAELPYQMNLIGLTATPWTTNSNITMGIQWQMLPDSEAHADTLLPCSGGYCSYGIYIYYCPRLGGGQCPPTQWAFTGFAGILNGTYSYLVVSVPEPMTYREANKLLEKKLGSSGTLSMDWGYQPTAWGICVGTILVGRSSVKNDVPAYPGACTNIPMVPISCDISSSSLDLQHGTFSSADLNAANTSKSATASFMVNCNRDTTLTFSLAPEKLTLTDGLTSDLTLSKNGQTIANGSNQTIKENQADTFDITSTLNGVGKIAPNSYSASAVLVISAQ